MFWPQVFYGKVIPEVALLTTGQLLVPDELPAYGLASLEQHFRGSLWPKLPEGYCRYGREFHWSEAGRVLDYRIIDYPKREGP
jgi:hypothetical protein